MNRTPIKAAIAATLLLSACSSSSNKDTNTDESSTQTNPESGPEVSNSDIPANDSNSGTAQDNPSTDGSSPTASVDLRTMTTDILVSLAGYELETLSVSIADTANNVVKAATTSTTLPDSIVGPLAQASGENLPLYPATRVNYDCAQGGSLTTATVDGSGTEQSGNSVTGVSYVFDQCQLDANTGETLNGSMTVLSRDTDADGIDHVFDWQSFEWSLAGTQTISITASIATQKYALGNRRAASIQDYTHRDNGLIGSSVQNARFNLSNKFTYNFYEYTVDTAGELIAPSGTSITVVTDPQIYRFNLHNLDRPIPGAPSPPSLSAESIPLKGQITFTASDGSSLEMVGSGNEPGDSLVDITYMDASGNTSTLPGEQFPKLNTYELTRETPD